MARKPRPDPYTQGSLEDIYRYFFGPLIRYKPASLSIRDWMDVLFDARQRDITRYVAEKDFRLPGHYYAAAFVKVQGVGYRDVKAGNELWVRTDARRPELVDVEFHGGIGGRIQVFALTREDWERVSICLKEAER